MALSANKQDEYDTFTLEQKKKLAAKISAIRSKPDLKQIKNIIFTENPNIMVNKDSGGILMFFQNLAPLTYVKLDKYIKEMDAKKNFLQTSSISKTSDGGTRSDMGWHGYRSTLVSDSDDKLLQSKYKYSNSEKYIMKKKALLKQ